MMYWQAIKQLLVMTINFYLLTTCYRQTLSHNVVYVHLTMSGIQTHNVSGYRH